MAKRIDATRVKLEDSFHLIVPYLMPNRTEAEVSLTERFDVTKLMKYIEDRNKKEDINLKLFHCICYAMAKTIYHRPEMNRFIAGKYFWQRNDISLSFVAKQKLEDGAEERLMFLKTLPNMKVDDFSKIIIGDVKKARSQSGNELDKTMQIVGRLPRFLITFIFWAAKKLDFYGIMPAALMKGDPNFSTVLLSNLGSIGAGAPYHHLSNYGTNSLIVTIGTVFSENKKKFLDMTFTLDERISDGFYFAKSLRYTHHCLENPKMLNTPIKESFPEGII